jgi:hypothetical protein
MRPIIVVPTLAVLTIACLSMPALATEADKPVPKPAKEKRVCRESTPTGSRLTVRTCHSKSEWEAIDKERQAHADREVGRVQAMSQSDGTGFNPN